MRETAAATPGRSRPVRIVFPDGDPAALSVLEGEYRERLEALGEFIAHGDAPATPEEFLGRVRGAHGILLGWRLPEGVLGACPDLEVVSFLGAGAESFVDLEEASRHGVVVTACPGYGDNAVAEHAVALLLALVRAIPALDASVRSGVWDQGQPVGEVRGSTLGVIGYGGIGARVAELGRGLGMRVLCWSWPGFPGPAPADGIEAADLERLLEESDAVSLHLRLTEETRRFLDGAAMDRMQPGALLINTARGGLVDEAALVERLASGRLGGAALDVFAEEPLPADHPLRSLPGVVLTPHVAFNTRAATEALFDMAIANLEAHFAPRGTGDPPTDDDPIGG